MTDSSFEVPQACTLSGGDARARVVEWRRLLRRAAVTRTPVAGGTRIALAPLDGVRTQLERLIEAERECCPFLDFELEETDGLLAVTVPGDA